MSRVVELEHRRDVLAGEADVAVRVVLEDHEAVRLGEGEQRLALGERQRVPGGVLEVRDDVHELRLHAAVEQRAQLVGVDAVGLERHHPHVGAEAAEVQQRAVVRRLLDDDGVAGGDEGREEERVGLHRAVRDEDVVVVDAVLLGDPVPQGRVADARAVAGHAAGVVGERRHGAVAQAVDVDDVEGRSAAGEGDGVGWSHAPRVAVRAQPWVFGSSCRPTFQDSGQGGCMPHEHVIESSPRVARRIGWRAAATRGARGGQDDALQRDPRGRARS